VCSCHQRGRFETYELGGHGTRLCVNQGRIVHDEVLSDQCVELYISWSR
jgi:hypothetical protein